MKHFKLPLWTQLIPSFYLLCIAFVLIWLIATHPIPVDPRQVVQQKSDMLDNLPIMSIMGN